MKDIIFKKNLNLSPIVIAEVGQNHQGDVNLAKKYIKVFAEAGADFIKFQSRNNKTLFDPKAYNSLYNSENSFGTTYGSHREALELNKKELTALKNECKKYRVGFMVTPFDEKSLELITKIGVDLIKIASFDLGNLPFINKIADKKIPVVMSVGGGNFKQIFDSVKILEKKKIKNIILHCVSEYPCEYDRLDLEKIKLLKKKFKKKKKIKNIILHCVSEYPCEYDRLDLEKIKLLKKKFKKSIIGSSDHFNGTLSGPIAYMVGARVFEKHVTLNRGWKGSDHSFALEPIGFKKFVRDIKRIPKMIKAKSSKEIGKESVFKKLGKSLVLNKKKNKGEKITINDLSGKIFLDQYIPVRDSNKVIDKVAKKDFNKGEILKFRDIG